MIYYPLKRLKNCLSIPLTYGLNEPAVEDNPEWPRYIRITDFDDNDCLRDETFKSLHPKIAEAGILKKGDILLARSGATVGKAFHFNDDIKACYAGYLIRARFNVKTIIPKFFSYITKSVFYSDWKNHINIQATIQNISAEKYYQFEFPCPQLNIQQRIVDYLDEKTKAIDTRISVLEKKSEAYKRLKASVINRAVTRGLNSDVTLKDSGIEWIGMIPEHWEVIEIKAYCKKIFAGATPSTKINEYWDGEIPWLPSGSCHNGIIHDYHHTITEQGLKNSSTKLVKANTTLMAMTGATCSNVGYLTFESCTNQSVCAYIENTNICYSKYLFYMLQAAKGYILTFQTGGAQAGINIQDCSLLKVPKVPLSEQQSIANYLDTKCSEIDKLIDYIVKQIDALKRLKRSLINEVVTGKRKV